MNATIFWRFVWKEYRAQRAFWISMAVLTVVVELLLLENYRRFYPTALAARAQLLFTAGMALSALYALASGAALFAAERETEAYDFLRGLPAPPLVMFAGKVFFALASSVILYVMAWSLALVLAGQLPEPGYHRIIWAVFGLGGLELLAWGLLFSLLLKRTLVAVGCAVATAPAAFWVSSVVSMEVFEASWSRSEDPFFTASVRLLIVALLAAAEVGLAARWLRERRSSSSRRRDERLSDDQIEAIFDQVLPARPQGKRTYDRSPHARTMLGQLVWQEFRQSAVMSAVLVAMLLPIVFLNVETHTIDESTLRASWFLSLVVLIFPAAVLTAPLLGSLVFLADQTGYRFRFLAEHGMPPRLVWLSRQIRGLAVLLAGMLLVPLLCLPLLIRVAEYEKTMNVLEGIGCWGGFAVVAYVCGQLCSMAFRSGLLAAFFGVILTAMICAWAAFMYLLCLSWLWSVVPLLLAFLAITWLHTPNWLVERKSWPARFRLALVAAVPLVAILVAVPLVRLYGIPLVGPGFDVAELTRPISAEEKETLRLFRRASQHLAESKQDQQVGGPAAVAPPAADELARRKLDEQAVTLAMEASLRPPPGLCDSNSDVPQLPPLDDDLAWLVLHSGQRMQSEGKLDAALDRYLAALRIASAVRRQGYNAASLAIVEVHVCQALAVWAAQKGQTPQRVQAALQTLQQQWPAPESFSAAIKERYRRSLQYLQSEPSSHDSDISIFLWLPWERARALRLLNQLTAQELAKCRDFVEALARGRSVPPPTENATAPDGDRDVTYRLIGGSVGPNIQVRVDGRVVNLGYLGDYLVIETYHRATRLILALEAWRLEHSSLPDSLDDLRGTYLDELPVDPYTGAEFGYEPKGLPYYIVSTTHFSEEKTIEPDRPFLFCDTWSARPPRDARSSDLRRIENNSGGASKTETWNNIWVFPIP